jgi:hypothetical protein
LSPHVATVKIDQGNITVSVKFDAGNGLLGVEKDVCKKLKEQIIAIFESKIKK